MRIFSSTNTTISGTGQKVIETGNGFLLNTQYYMKDILTPVPFENLYEGGTQYNLSISKFLYLQAYSWNDSYNNFGVIKDTTIENRYYISLHSGFVSGTRNEQIRVYEEKDDTIQRLTAIGSGDYQFLDVIDQDDTYVYYTYKSNLTWYVCKFHKVTFATTTIYTQVCSTSYPNPVVLYKNESYIYILCYVNNNYSFVLVNKTSSTASVIGTIWRGNNSNTTAIKSSVVFDKHSIVKFDDNTIGVYGVDVGNPAQPIDLYIIDISSNTISLVDFTVNWTVDTTQLNIDTTVYSVFNKYMLWILEINGSKYLNIGVFNQNFENVKHVQEQGIYTFILDENTKTATLTGYNQIDQLQQIHGMLLANSKRHVLIGKLNSFQIVKFDIITQKYETTNEVITDCYCAGFDELERIWYEKTDTSVNMINLQDAQSVQIEFEKTYYEYTGENISTYINFSALNYLNEGFAGQFKLTLGGPAIFIESNATELTIDYNAGIMQIGIIITGASPVTIYPEFIG